MFKIRIHKDYLDDVSKFEDYKLFMVHEHGSAARAHYQGIISWDKTMQALRARVKSMFPSLKGNGSYSIGKLEDEYDDYITYLCKGDSCDKKPQIIINSMNIEVDSRHEQYWKRNAELKKDKKKPKKLLERIFERHPINIKDDTSDYHLACQSIYQFYIDESRPINPTIIGGLVRTYLAQQSDYHKANVLEWLMSRNLFASPIESFKD